VFGSDFAPVPAVPPIIENVLAAVTSRAEADAVFHNNARSLLERFGVNHFAAAA
jgi:predicted TIM-barrel fold metal-dependent hydrolase